MTCGPSTTRRGSFTGMASSGRRCRRAQPPKTAGQAHLGAGPNDFWVGAPTQQSLNHWNGLEVDFAGEPGGSISGLWGSAADDVWAVGWTFDATPIFDLGSGRALVLHWNGLAWDRIPSTWPWATSLSGVWGSRSDDVWAVGAGSDIVHWDGHAWSAPPGTPHVALDCIWGSGPDDVWAFGYDESGLGALHWDGQGWTKRELLDASVLGVSGPLGSASLAWGSGRDDIWVVTSFQVASKLPSLFLHWDGHSWSRDSSLDAQVAASMYVAGMWGTGPDDVWAVGEGASRGIAVHWDGTRWSAVTSVSSADNMAFKSVWSSSPNDVWIGTETTDPTALTSGGVLHWDGQSWSQPLSGATQMSFTVGGSGRDDIWAIPWPSPYQQGINPPPAGTPGTGMEALGTRSLCPTSTAMAS